VGQSTEKVELMRTRKYARLLQKSEYCTKVGNSLKRYDFFRVWFMKLTNQKRFNDFFSILSFSRNVLNIDFCFQWFDLEEFLNFQGTTQIFQL